MKPLPTEGYSGLYFTTATIKGWKHLLKPDKYKMIVTDAMTFCLVRSFRLAWCSLNERGLSLLTLDALPPRFGLMTKRNYARYQT